MAQPKSPTHSFSFGDRVVHAAKPEWGSGVVSKAVNQKQSGVASQSVTVRFERGGLKTLNTAFAELVPESSHHPTAPQPDVIPDDQDHRGGDSAGGPRRDANGLSRDDAPAAEVAKEKPSWLDEASAVSPDKAMARLPEACTDPFSSVERRFEATLKQYRFEPKGASLLDWAAAQTGLRDPLSRFSRQELEQYFRRYADTRDAHLLGLAQELRKQKPQELERLAAQAPTPARNTLRRVHAGR